MALVVGIDEAGYGPTLGPLIVGASVWQVAPAAAEHDFWQQLSDCVCRKPARNEWRLAINDSKKIYNRKKGIAALERPVLAVAQAAGLPTETTGDLLDALGGLSPGREFPPPWYRDLSQSLPVDPVHSGTGAIAERLSRCMASTQLRCAVLMAEIVPEHVFNQRVQHTRNKAAVLLECVLRLIDRAAQTAGEQDVHIHVDRLGGRQDYRGLLLSAFPDRHLHVQETDEQCSRYRLASQQNDWLIDFRVDADQHYLPVALASMTAKYVRELLMQRFNAFWQNLLPTVTPTAGYYQDAQRFLTDIRPVLPEAGLRAEQFVRRR